jgi:hypothetical protein
MNRRFRPWLCLMLVAISGCERPARKTAGGEDGKSPPAATRARRDGAEDAPDPRLGIRTAFADAREIPDAGERHKALAALVWEAHEIDPALANEAFSQLETDSPEKILLLQHFAMRLTDEDPQRALEWAASLGSEREIEAARARIAMVVADADPRRAAEMLAESVIESRELDVAIVQVLQHWTARNATEAAEWVAVFPSGELREAAVKTVLSQWVGESPDAAFAWMDSLTGDAMRRDAAHALQDAYLEQAPLARGKWLESAPPGLRLLLEEAARQADK